jgi:hypothetical protein
MQEVRAVIPRDPEACWRAFIDPATLAAWVPGLRKARVIQLDAEGLPQEILFEFGASLTYSLVYTYDHAARETRWQPRAGKRDAVAGFARFDPLDGDTAITYGLEQGDGRSPAEKDVGDLSVLVAAFVRWMSEERRR